MPIHYKNQHLEKTLTGLNVVMSALVVAIFVTLFGFHKPLLPARWLYAAQVLLLVYFVMEKVIRTLNAELKAVFWRSNWMEGLVLGVLGLVVVSRMSWSAWVYPESVWHFALGLYLLFQVVVKVCHNTLRLASLGRNPTRTLMASFLVLVFAGAGILCLPNASTGKPLGFIDALFTATSATCVTGLVVKDTGRDFTLLGQLVILTLIQLGGLGIVVFGAVFAILLRQALTLRESAAIQDLLSADALSRLSHTIGFILLFTMVAEAIGTLAMLSLWSPDPNWKGTFAQQQWFYSLFHAVSAFCNAGFGLYSDSLESFENRAAVYGVIAPLIILGGLGFSVLYNLSHVAVDRSKRILRCFFHRQTCLMMALPKRITLQSKIVLSVTGILIVAGTVLLYVSENIMEPQGAPHNTGWGEAFFQSVSARTAGFNTISIREMSSAGRMVLMILMFIGGSPGSAAGGIKTVTLAILVMAVITTLRKRSNVELFKRSVSMAVVGRVVTVSTLFVVVFLAAALCLIITEQSHAQTVTTDDCLFETMSALGTVGLSTGITPLLTGPGKCIIILVMLFGRLGPLTLLTALTFELKPARYSYPEEDVMVG